MRKLRIIGKPGSKYHVISRFVDRQFALGDDKAKRVFFEIMMSQADFSGVEILTYCLMGNHFHMLVLVPERAELPEDEVLRRIAKIWPEKQVDLLRKRLVRMRAISVEGEALVTRELDRFRRRMFNLSEFVKDVKQRFSTWFNRAHERKGTLFEERFRSVLVEDGPALRLMAAYIDLNPVRAGLVDDPVDYPWCGYARAVGGNRSRRHGLRTIMTDPRDSRVHPWTDVARRYRLWLFERGMETQHRDGRPKKQGFTRADAIAAWTAEGAVPSAKLLRCKARYLTDSLIYGGREFIEDHIENFRGQLAAKHPHAHEGPGGLCSLVNLRGPRTG